MLAVVRCSPAVVLRCAGAGDSGAAVSTAMVMRGRAGDSVRAARGGRAWRGGGDAGVREARALEGQHCSMDGDGDARATVATMRGRRRR
jgi:hypothetical protein